jgi:hypothetical protein
LALYLLFAQAILPKAGKSLPNKQRKNIPKVKRILKKYIKLKKNNRESGASIIINKSTVF